MARQSLSVQRIGVSGLTPAVSPAHVDGHAFYNNQGRTIVTVINENATEPVTVSITPTDTVEGLEREPRTYEIAAGDECVIAGLTSGLFEQQSGTDAGKIYLDFADGDVLTDVDLKAFMID